MNEEPKMKDYDKIVNIVQHLRELGKELEVMQQGIETERKELEKYGLRCNNITSCVEVGTKCYKCKNNHSRRSYFRDLLRRGEDVGIYAMSASMYDAVEEE